MPFSGKCPICESDGQLLYSLEADFIRTKLKKYYDAPVPQDINISNYKMLKCRTCFLEFAWPKVPGSEGFYSWITRHSDYYPDARWEWEVVLDIIKKKHFPMANLLEIGCGTGEFLKKAQKINNLTVVGIDLAHSSVEECHRSGLKTYCETIENYSLNPDHKIKLFDFVVAFHTLEHLANPKEFIASLLPLLNRDGSIFLSTPYSPMSFESSWFDPLNHPPHHLTRWDENSYKMLARKFGMSVDFFMPDAASLFSRTLTALNLQFNERKTATFTKLIGQAILSPIKTVKEFATQSKRLKVNNKTAANVVLVQLIKTSI